MPELEAVVQRPRKAGQGLGEAVIVAVEVRRQLPEDRAELRRCAEWCEPFEEAPEPGVEVAQPPEVVSSGLP